MTMKRLLFFIAFLCSLSTWAQPAGWHVETSQPIGRWLAENVSMVNAPVKTKDAVKLGKPQNAPEAVETPSGKLYTYALTNKRVSQAGMTSNSGIADTVYVDGTTVYFKNLVDGGSDGSYAVGKLTKGDMTSGTITFENGVEYAKGVYAYVGTIDDSEHLVPNKSAAAFTFTIKNGVITSDVPAETKGHFYLMGYTKANGLAGYNIDYKLEPVPSDLENVKIPQNVMLTAYEGVCDPVFNKSSKFITYIGTSGSDIYMKNIIPGLGESVIKGKIVGSKIEFDVAKYIGKYEDFYISFYAGELVKSGDNFTLQPVNTYKMTMDYDPETGRIKCNDVMVFLAGTTTLGGYWNCPEFNEYTVEPVTVPSKAEAERYTLTSRLLPDTENGGRSSIEAWVLRNGNDFYFKSIYTPNQNLAFKGTLNADGKTISVAIPQYLGAGYQGQPIQLAAATHDLQNTVPVSALYNYADDNKTIQFNYDSETGKISYDGCLCTVVYGLNNAITGLDTPEWTLQKDTVVTMPDDADKKLYVLYTERLRDYTRMEEMYIPAYITTVGVKGDMYYLHGLNEDFTKTDDNATIVGKRIGDKIVFDMPQLISSKGKKLVYAYVADYDEGKKDIVDSNDKTLEFTVDDETGTISCNRSISVKATGSPLFYYVKPSFKVYAPKPAKPKAPIPSDYHGQVYNGQSYRYAHTAEFFIQDVDGNYISPDSITYSVYFDGELYTFLNNVYFDEFTEDVTEVPLSLSSTNFNNALYERRIWTAEDPSTFGVQEHYYCNGVKTSSDIVTIDMKTGELTTTEVNAPVPVPANPTPEGWRPRGSNQYMYYADVPEKDTEGKDIDAEKLSFRIYMDNDLYTFKSIEYYDFDTDVTEVPVTLNSSTFSLSGTEHMMILRKSPNEKIGIQTVYTDGTNKTVSQIAYYNITTGEITYLDDPNTSGIAADSVEKKIVKQEYYLPSGCKTLHPVSGLHIVKTIYSDGTSSVNKSMIK